MAKVLEEQDVGSGERSLVRYEARDGVAILTLDDPPANTYTYEMMQHLDAAILRARMDDSVTVVVLTGAGEKFFCAGANMMVQGDTFDFDKALELGLVNQVIDAASADAFMEQVLEYARSFTPPNRAAKAVGNIKRAVQTGWELPIAEGLAVERELQQLLFQSEDAREGLKAYTERRKAEFKGR
jgi:enoyl-CoA hydratase/carnithine racemase